MDNNVKPNRQMRHQIRFIEIQQDRAEVTGTFYFSNASAPPTVHRVSQR